MNLDKMQHKAKTKSKGKSDMPPAGASLEHDCRSSSLEHPDRPRGNDKIDPTQTHKNYDLADELRERLYSGKSAAEVYHEKYRAAQQRHKEVTGQNLRSDAVTLMSWVVTAPQTLPEERHDEFFALCYEWFCERYGEENVIAANVHKDETNDHMHFKFMPFVEDKKHGGVKLCAKNLETPSSMKKIHPELEKHLTKIMGVKVELLNGATEHGNKTKLGLEIAELQQRLTALRDDVAQGNTDKENIIAQIDALNAMIVDKQAAYDAADSRPEPPSRKDYPEGDKGDKKYEKAYKSWETKVEKWDKRHGVNVGKQTAAAVAAAAQKNKADRADIDNEVERRYKARSASLDGRERAVKKREQAADKTAAEQQQTAAEQARTAAELERIRHELMKQKTNIALTARYMADEIMENAGYQSETYGISQQMSNNVEKSAEKGDMSHGKHQ